MSVLVQRVVADVEVGGVDQPVGRQARPARATRRRHRQWLLADDVPTCGKDAFTRGRWRSLGEVTWTASTAGSSRSASSDGRPAGPSAPPAPRSGCSRGRRAPDADPAQCFDMHRADRPVPITAAPMSAISSCHVHPAGARASSGRGPVRNPGRSLLGRCTDFSATNPTLRTLGRTASMSRSRTSAPGSSSSSIGG